MADRGTFGSGLYPDPRWGGYMKPGLPAVKARKGTAPTYESHTDLPAAERKVEMDARLYSEAMGFENRAGERRLKSIARGAVQECLSQTRSVLEHMRQKWLTLYRLYRGDTLAQALWGSIPLHEPEPFKAVETVHPRMMRVIFQQDPLFGLRGHDWQDDEPSKHQTALINQQLRDTRWKQTASLLLRELLIYGTCVQKTFWEQDIKEVAYQRVRRKPKPSRPGVYENEIVQVKREEMIFDGNMVRPVSIFDLFAPPTVNPCDAPWIGDKSLWPSYEVVKMGELGLWLNLDELKDRPGTESPTLSDEFKQRKAYSYGVFDDRDGSSAPHISSYMVFDVWLPLAIDGPGREVMCNVTVIDPDQLCVPVVIRKAGNWHGEKPYQVCRYIALHEEFFGIGILEPTARTSFELDAKKNQYHLATALEANPMYVADDTANISDSQLVASPGRMLRAATSEGIKPLFTPKQSQSALEAMQELKQSFRETTGITAPLMAAQVGGTKTASQHNSEINESSMRILGGIVQFEDELILPMVNQMAWNNQQFLSRPKTINVLGPNGLRYQDRYTVRPDTITGRFSAYAVVSERLSTQMVQVQQLINLLDRAPIINQATGIELVKYRPLLAKIFREGFGFRDVHEFIAVDPREAGLLSATEEHEAWMHGVVPRVRDQDNHVDHFSGHNQFFESDTFKWLEDNMPHVAAEAVNHAIKHLVVITQNIELQGQQVADAAQMGAVQQAVGGGGGQAGGRGFAEPGQNPESPKFRSEGSPNESEQPEAEATRAGPNPGAS